jgi:3-deoxy-D-manno-octulosonic-acid transferase
MLVDCYRKIVERYPSAQLLLAPRHIERAEAVEAMVRSKGLAVQRRSRIGTSGQMEASGPRVTILDSRGELASVYREALVAYVGGTLVPVGGHNLLEPAVWAKPVLFGPHTDHCAEIAELLIQSGGGHRVRQADDLTEELLQLFDHPEDCAKMGQTARAVVTQNQGALQVTADAITSLLTLERSSEASPIAQGRIPLMAGQ